MLQILLGWVSRSYLVNPFLTLNLPNSLDPFLHSIQGQFRPFNLFKCRPLLVHVSANQSAHETVRALFTRQATIFNPESLLSGLISVNIAGSYFMFFLLYLWYISTISPISLISIHIPIPWFLSIYVGKIMGFFWNVVHLFMGHTIHYLSGLAGTWVLL